MRDMKLLTLALLVACADSATADSPKHDTTYTGPREVAILAGGCFWGMENVMRKAPGVVVDRGRLRRRQVDERSSTRTSPSGDTGHAESVRIVFDPRKISYEDLLLHWYFRGHDPTHARSPEQRRRHAVPLGDLHDHRTTRRDRGARSRRRSTRAASGSKPIVTRSSRRRRSSAPRTITRTTWSSIPNGYNDH